MDIVSRPEIIATQNTDMKVQVHKWQYISTKICRNVSLITQKVVSSYFLQLPKFNRRLKACTSDEHHLDSLWPLSQMFSFTYLFKWKLTLTNDLLTHDITLCVAKFRVHLWCAKKQNSIQHMHQSVSVIKT